MITVIYLYIAYVLHSKNDYITDDEKVDIVINNLIVSDILFWTWYATALPIVEFSIWNLVMFYVAQDIYFYCVHRLFHMPKLYSFHKLHHSDFGPVYAWLCSVPEQILVNLASVGVPWMLFPNSLLALFVLIPQQIFTSINGHTKDSPHSIHHTNIKKRYGTIYILDKIFGSY